MSSIDNRRTINTLPCHGIKKLSSMIFYWQTAKALKLVINDALNRA